MRPIVKSRASSFRAYTQKLTLLFFLVFSILLASFHSSEPEKIKPIQTYFDDVSAGILSLFTSPGHVFVRLYDSIHHYFVVYAENEQLRYENAQLKLWQQTALRLESENHSMKSLLALKDHGGQSYISAKIVGDAISPFSKTYLLKVGAHDGVKMGQAVVVGKVLVGHIVEVGQSSSRVLLLSDFDSHIAVKFLSSGDRAMINGNGLNGVSIEFIGDDVRYLKDDYIVTSGVEGYLPEGLLIGRLKPGTMDIVPLINYERLDIVQIVIENKSLLEEIEKLGQE
jgi:rod shape-determining protein MreC